MCINHVYLGSMSLRVEHISNIILCKIKILREGANMC